MKRFFITSSGTDIGKTFVTCKLIEALQKNGQQVNAIKPIISGWDADDEGMDSLQIQRSLNGDVSIDDISPWRFKAALSPDMAARAEVQSINLDDVVSFCNAPLKADVQLIEAVGGVMVPLNDKQTVLQWMETINIPVVLVVGSYLGSISHSLTALKVLQTYDIKISSIVVSQSVDSVNINELETTLRNFTNVPIIALERNADQVLANDMVKYILGA